MEAASIPDPLEGDAALAEGLLVEADQPVIIPKKGGLFADDGTVKIAVIRPCASRGKRLRGLPPIYTPQMLAENAGVFIDWHMFMDHLSEGVARALRQRGRSIGELGGRITESWYDPEFTTKKDDEKGYRPGAVLARAIPYAGVKALLEADPQAIEVSINCYPTSARPAAAPWNPGLRGMLIEGFRKVPRGSVDWVLRGGAGGGVVQEEAEQFAVSVLEGLYSAGQLMDIDSTDLNLEKLAEQLQGECPELAEEIRSLSPNPAPAAEGLSEERIRQIAREVSGDSGVDADQVTEQVTEKVSEAITEDRHARSLGELAEAVINDADLPDSWKAKLRQDVRVTTDGIPPILKVTESQLTDGATPEDLVEDRAEDMVAEAIEMYQAAAPGPRVSGHGGGTPARVEESAEDKAAYENFLRESGDLTDGEGKPRDVKDVLVEMETA